MVENVKDLLKAHSNLKREVYLDNENSTIVPPEVLDTMMPLYNKYGYGNPTLTHKPGWEAFEVIMESAQKIAGYIGCESVEELNFTPGETEANNVALIGASLARKEKGTKIIISQIEPLSVLHVVEMLQKSGFTIQKIPVNQEGFLKLEELKKAVDGNTILVSISLVNHEIGTIQPIKDILDIVKDRNSETIFHTDVSDAFGRIPFSFKGSGVDLATASSYKILGPRGVGGLCVKEGLAIEKILEGQIGTQKLWPGVENTPLIGGFAKACELHFESLESVMNHIRGLRDMLISGILDSVSDTMPNGPIGGLRATDNANITFLRCEGEALTIELSLRGVYVSSGSACTRRLLQPSHVLGAIGRKFEEAHGSILMKVTRLQSKEDISYVLDVIPEAVSRIRGIVGSTGLD